MTESLNRAEMLRVTGLLRPALATADYIPALTHIAFDGATATAYNDQLGIVVRCAAKIRRLVPGDRLARVLGSFAGDTVAVNVAEGGQMLVTSGRSKITLPTLGLDAWPFSLPDGGDEYALTADMVRAVERCLLSVGADAKHPAQMGVTLAPEAGVAVFYSTDNLTMSRAATRTPLALPGDTPVILPTAFCQQVVALWKATHAAALSASPKSKGARGVLVVLPGGVLAEISDDAGVAATVFHRQVVDLEPMDFGAIFARHADPAKVTALLQKIPDAMDAALGRSLLVLAREKDKTTAARVSGKLLSLSSESALGSCDEEVAFDAPDAGPHSTDPALLARGLKACSRMAFLKTGTALGDDGGDFLHLVAHVSH